MDDQRTLNEVECPGCGNLARLRVETIVAPKQGNGQRAFPDQVTAYHDQVVRQGQTPGCGWSGPGDHYQRA